MLIAVNLFAFNPKNPITNFTISENREPNIISSNLVQGTFTFITGGALKVPHRKRVPISNRSEKTMLLSL